MKRSVFERVVFCLMILFLGTFSISTGEAHQHTILISTFSKDSKQPNLHHLNQDWTVKIWEGSSDFALIEENRKKVLHLRSREASFSIYKELNFDLAQHPILNMSFSLGSQHSSTAM